jgi:hypothetical protein
MRRLLREERQLCLRRLPPQLCPFPLELVEFAVGFQLGPVAADRLDQPLRFFERFWRRVAGVIGFSEGDKRRGGNDYDGYDKPLHRLSPQK